MLGAVEQIRHLLARQVQHDLFDADGVYITRLDLPFAVPLGYILSLPTRQRYRVAEATLAISATGASVVKAKVEPLTAG